MKDTCPCGLDQTYQKCCGQYIESGKAAPTPEALMRSRYTAFTKVNTGYIKNTMVSPALDDFDDEETRQFAENANWLKLEVVSSSVHGNQGNVEFLAHYQHNQDKCVIHEVGDFLQKDGQWYYVDGITPQAISSRKVGRNDPCPCGSGKKYKKCCA